ncbi:MAG TPA: LysR family transcriptional regulator, partial [Blastococcus sp.]
MVELRQLEYFLAVVEEGSFACVGGAPAARVNELSSTTARKYSSCRSSTTDRLRPPSRNVDHPGG